MLKKNKGITLIALVITIIVIVILTAITINAVVGDNGIISESKQARDDYYTAENAEQETLDSAVSAIRRAREEAGIINNGGNSNNNGNNNNNNTQKINTAVNSTNYGKIVYNYTAADLVWRLFYEDSNNIYLISETSAGDYPLNNISTVNYNSNTGVYSVIDSSYTSAALLSSEGRALMPLACGETSSLVGTNSTGINIFVESNRRANVFSDLYLCDTSKWTTYKTSQAAWAMGGPTIELFAASYNATHPSNQITMTMAEYGYDLTGSNGTSGYTTSEFGGIYRLKDSGMWWLAGADKATEYPNGAIVYDNNGILVSATVNVPKSARPVVCISKSTGFTCQFEVPRTGAIGAPVNTDKYGREVTNYTAAGLKWRLFYEDSNNIYLISETQDGDYPIKNVQPCNYTNNTYSPKDASYVSGESVSQQGKDLMPLAGGAATSSAGTITIGTNTNGINLFTSSNTNPNIWGTAFLCDTRVDGPWAAYKTEQAAWAMGGPTIELFAASYNATHQGVHQISLSIKDYGYTENTNDGWFLESENGGIYRLKTRNSNNGEYLWIASPGDYTNYVLRHTYDGQGHMKWYGRVEDSYLARPVVCIQKSSGFTYTLAPES